MFAQLVRQKRQYRVEFSLLERLPVTQEAAGSSPVAPAIRSCGDDTVRSKSFDIAHGRLAKEAAIFSVELAHALVADFVSRACGVNPIHKHPLPCPLQPQLLLVLKGAHRGQCAELMMKC